MEGTQTIERNYELEIQEAFDHLMQKLGKLNMEDYELITKAFEMAKDGHKHQKRKSGEPYILHPVEVARICVEEIGLGPTAVVCALLHDVVEDTEVSLEMIRDVFGVKVSQIVDGLTKLEKTYKTNLPQADNFKKVLKAMLVDVRVVLIKMADRMHNMRTLGNMRMDKQIRIAGETLFIYSPLAHRLGLYNIKTEFQDLCMKVLDRENYNMVAEKLQLTKKARQSFIENFINPLQPKIAELGVKFRIAGRAKSISSIFNKLKNKNVSFEEIYDLFAIRIILDVPLDMEKTYCWQVYSIVTDVHKPIPERLKDWVTTPKSNGYESLHTTVIGPEGKYVEVQIRTERMDEIAERGFAAHWKYKGIKSQQDHYGPWLDSIREILEDKDKDGVDFINDLRDQLFKDEVFVYTPKGDLKVLPKGATALDFAFSIHTEIGYHCSAVKVNNKLEPLNYELNNGDQVSIITNPNQKPNERWLKSAITSKARNKIKQAVKEEKMKIGEFGMESIQRKFKSLKIDFENNIDKLTEGLGYKNRPELYYDVYQGKLDITQELKKFDIEQGYLILKENKHEVKQAPKEEKKAGKGSKADIYLNGEAANGYKINLANCCSPVEGDRIFGFVSTTNGVNIHRTSCPNANHMMTHYGYRIMKAEWHQDDTLEYDVKLMIRGVDSMGLTQKLTEIITGKFGLNIRSFALKGEHGYFEGHINVAVNNHKQVNALMNELKKIEGISSIKRM